MESESVSPTDIETESVLLTDIEIDSASPKDTEIELISPQEIEIEPVAHIEAEWVPATDIETASASPTDFETEPFPPTDIHIASASPTDFEAEPVPSTDFETESASPTDTEIEWVPLTGLDIERASPTDIETEAASPVGWKPSLRLVTAPLQRIFGERPEEASSPPTSSPTAGTALRTFREWFDPGHLSARFLGDHRTNRRSNMFGNDEIDQDDDADENELPAAPQLKLSEVLQAAETLREVSNNNPDLNEPRRVPKPEISSIGPGMVEALRADTPAIFAIGPGMTVVGKISSEGTLNVFGRVEGELHASLVRLSDGAQVEGTINAKDVIVGGRFKGIIKAHQVTLTRLAVVEGEIHHRSLAIEAKARFAGVSHPQDIVAGEVTETRPTLQLVATEENRHKASRDGAA
jgi:cytoskeletal protein CcmA (bactofilin family)